MVQIGAGKGMNLKQKDGKIESMKNEGEKWEPWPWSGGDGGRRKLRCLRKSRRKRGRWTVKRSVENVSSPCQFHLLNANKDKSGVPDVLLYCMGESERWRRRGYETRVLTKGF